MPRMSTAERIEAEIVAAHMLCQMRREHDVRKYLREEHACSTGVAIAIVKKVREDQVAQAQRKREDILRDFHAVCDEATAMAFSLKDVRAVIISERFRAELGGFLRAEQRPEVAAGSEPDWLAGKSREQADCYGLMGKFPEELTATEEKTYTAMKALQAN